MANDAYTPAALRHAADARKLHDSDAYDNAIYLGGYAVECLLKGWIEAERGSSGGTRRIATHDLARLETVALAATIHRVDRHSVFPSDAVASARKLHWSPDTRYWRSGYRSDADSERLVEAVEKMVRDTIRPLVLDGVLTL